MVTNGNVMVTNGNASNGQNNQNSSKTINITNNNNNIWKQFELNKMICNECNDWYAIH